MRFMAMEIMGKANVYATQVLNVIDIVVRYALLQHPHPRAGQREGR